jgi:hypothetical protein
VNDFGKRAGFLLESAHLPCTGFLRGKHETIETLALIDCLPPHHDPPPPLTESSGSESWFAGTHEHFFNSIGPLPDIARLMGCLPADVAL